MQIESTHLVNIKEFCGATWSSKEMKVMRGNFACPLNAPKKFTLPSPSPNMYDPNNHVQMVGHKRVSHPYLARLPTTGLLASFAIHVYERRIVRPVGDANELILGSPSDYWTGTAKGDGWHLRK
jgi:hypothetical protein